MKYTKPIFEIIEIETNDVITASMGTGEITANGVTIKGPKDEFYANFSELLGNN